MMRRCFFSRIIATLLLALAGGATWAEVHIHSFKYGVFKEKLATRETIEQLRQGGYVLYIRHGYTINSRPDQEDRLDLSNCDTQRMLSDAGRLLMKELGKSIRAAGVPLGEIVASPMCRTRESAELAFQSDFKQNNALMYWTRMAPEEKLPRLEELQRLLSKPVVKGSNRVLMAHAPNLQDLIGFFVKPEGTVVVFAPKGADGYEYVASIHPQMWASLLE